MSFFKESTLFSNASVFFVVVVNAVVNSIVVFVNAFSNAFVSLA